jgi:hypothetical protein
LVTGHRTACWYPVEESDELHESAHA